MVGEQQLQNCACRDMCCPISLNALPVGGDSVVFGDDHAGIKTFICLESRLKSLSDFEEANGNYVCC